MSSSNGRWRTTFTPSSSSESDNSSFVAIPLTSSPSHTPTLLEDITKTHEFRGGSRSSRTDNEYSDEDEEWHSRDIRTPTSQSSESDTEQISWLSLPRKDQLFILSLARLSEPLTQTSLGTYIYFQLQSFEPTLPESTVSFQVGMIQAAFPAAQFLTAILWGRFADSEHGGRKRVIWIGLFGTMLSMIGFGFSTSFLMAFAFRFMGGALNGNIGVMRTMISEIIKEKKFQSRAFLLLPVTFNIGVIIGPILGGALADPVQSYPSLFGPSSLIGGKSGVQWMMRWPYALPNLMSATFLLLSFCASILFLEETSALSKDKPDPGLRIGRWIRQHIFREHKSCEYAALSNYDSPDDGNSPDDGIELLSPSSSHSVLSKPHPLRPTNKLPFHRIWTRNLIITLISHALLAMHVGTFNSIFYTYLSAPRYNPSSPHPPDFVPHGLHFNGGLAMPSARIGLVISIIGIIGIPLQFLLYPRVLSALGTAASYQYSLLLFPVAYTLVPFLSLVPSWTSPPEGVSGPAIWMCLIGVLFIQVMGRTFAIPCTTILINNASPHPSALGTVHGIGQSVSSLARTIGPIFFGWLLGRGMDVGVMGLAWWCLAGVAVVGSVVGRFLWEGDGHEILMEGEVKE